MHIKKYVRWVNRTLHKCKVERLDQFRVCFDLNKFAQHEIDKWPEFAFARQVQRQELDLGPFPVTSPELERMEDNTILYNAHFKLYEITNCSSGEESWYKWVERSRYLMRRVKISRRVLRACLIWSLDLEEVEDGTQLVESDHWLVVGRRNYEGTGSRRWERSTEEIELNSDGFIYTIPIWVESPVTVSPEKEKGEPLSTIARI
ncbi:hypothetical protein RDI58_011499 [Solanum bulbocastanum]|uniref:Uncharacterized protein n=1 Tax=Solanum bulbocastanum TaxID=147425 RepID=A0AAN8YKI9_SOLBU